MLQVKGHFNEKSSELRDGEWLNVSMNELAELYGIELPEKGGYKVIKLSQIVEKDRSGERRVPMEYISRSCVLNHPKTGEEFELRITKRGASGINRTRISLSNSLGEFNYDFNRAEEYLFLCLNPYCENGPNFNPVKRSKIKMFDPNAEARKIIESRNLVKQLENEIATESAWSVRIKAAGLEVKGRKVEADFNTEWVVRIQLIGLAQSNPSAFVKVWSSQDTWNKGLLRIASFDGIIDQTTMRGIKGWHWMKGPRHMALLAQIGSTQDAYEQLKQAADADPEVYTIIENILKPKEQEGASEKSELEQLNTKSLVDLCVAKGVIQYNENTLKVKLIKGKGPGKGILENKTSEEWLVETYKKVADDKALQDEIIKILEEKE